MNPSAPGWLVKLGSILEKSHSRKADLHRSYEQWRHSGFIYGLNLSGPSFYDWPGDLSSDELAKINLVAAQYTVYRFEMPEDHTFQHFAEKLTTFYNDLELYSPGFFEKLFPESQQTNLLERHIHQRVLIESHPLWKNFELLLTNALLFIDVLTFMRFLRGEKHPRRYAASLEGKVLELVYSHFDGARAGSAKQQHILRLIESSVSFISPAEKEKWPMDKTASYSLLEEQYLSDLHSVLTKVFTLDQQRLKRPKIIQVSGYGQVYEGLLPAEMALEDFFARHEQAEALLKGKHPLLNFYQNSNQLVRRLIQRNRSRLMKELTQSRELLTLLHKSTYQELDHKERKRMRKQLLDLFKTIPSLAIFALPGGAILLPLFIKLIPDLLPSTFDDNALEEDTDLD